MQFIEHNAKFRLINEFFECDTDQLQKDYPSILEINISKKSFLYRQGDYCSHLFWIKSGIVKLSHLTEQGSEVTIDLLRRGDVIGCFQSTSAGQEINETAQALGEVNFYRIAYSDFKAMMSHQAELAWYVIEDMYARKQRVERKLRTILTQPVEMS
ncbi:MAG: Crp/Fnr family transcriptional regulator [Pseudomonadota bacterium]